MMVRMSLVVACLVGSAGAQPRDAWIREIVDYDRADGTVNLTLVKGAPSIAAGFPRDLAVVTLVRGGQSWTSTAIHEGRRADMIVSDPSGAHRLVLGSDKGRGLLTDGKLDLIGLPAAADFDLTFDSSGGVLACAVEGSNLGRYVKLAERGTRPGTWKLGEVSQKPARQCAVTASDDGAVVIATANSAESWVYVRRDGAWTWELLSKRPGGGMSPMIAVARAPDGGVGVAFVDDTGIGLARLTKTGWTRSSLVKDAGGVSEALALAFDGTGRAHVAYMTWVPNGGSSRGAISYAVEGSAPSRIEEAAASRISLVVDATGSPHLAYFHTSSSARPDVLVYVRARKPEDVADAWIRDTEAFVTACGEQLAVELGRVEDPDVAKRGRTERLCRAWDRATPSLEQIEARCTSGDGGACLVGGLLLADRQQAFEHYEVIDLPCGKGTRCTTTYNERFDIKFGASRVHDNTRSRALYERACQRGVGIGCMLADTPAKGCSAQLPLACSVALGTRAALDAEAQKTMRSELAKACAYKRLDDEPHPEACNALAYLEDTGRGGPKNPAAARAHHAQACVDGAMLSCAKLVGGAKPRGLAADTFAERMEQRCENHGEDICLALATAYQRGWLVKRAPAEAKRVLAFACDELASADACKRLGKPVPAKQPD